MGHKLYIEHLNNTLANHNIALSTENGGKYFDIVTEIIAANPKSKYQVTHGKEVIYLGVILHEAIEAYNNI